MQKLDIEFQRPNGRSSSLGIGLLVLSGLIVLALIVEQSNLSEQLETIEATQSRIAASKKNTADNKQKSEEDKILQASYTQLTLPWDEVFAAVEEAANDQVLLLALEGDGRNRVVKISAQAPNSEIMLSYLEMLKSNGKLNGWRLLNHRADDKGELHFVIQAELPEGI